MAWVKPQAEIEAALRDHPAVVAGVGRVAEAIQTAAVTLARLRAFDSGEYAGSIILVMSGDGRWMVVATAPHAWFVEVGTGIHGPKRAMILAATTTRAGVFKFTVNDGDGERTIITDQHQGRPARHVMRDAAEQVAQSLPNVKWMPSPA